MSKFVSLLYSSLDFNRHARRYDAQERHAITTLFLLSGLYCLVALFFLLFFGFHAVLAGDMSYALMMFAFACVTVASYFLLWKLGLYTWGGHLVVLLMAAMCLVLFYTGGEEATGPMWYLVFPVLAMFAQGRVAGICSVLVLLLLSLWIFRMQPWGFDPQQYSDAFLLRLLAVYLTISALSFLFAFFRHQAELQLKHINKQLEILTNTDKLSGLLNRRGMESELEHMVETYNRFELVFTLVIFDIDDFKNINDKHGHVFGDFVIQNIGEICRSTLRRVDYASRWGGEEFLLLLPGTDREGARVLAERLKDKITRTAFTLEGVKVSITASFGVCQHSGPGEYEKTIRYAVRNMYAAKQQGKNRVVSSVEQESGS